MFNEKGDRGLTFASSKHMHEAPRRAAVYFEEVRRGGSHFNNRAPLLMNHWLRNVPSKSL